MSSTSHLEKTIAAIQEHFPVAIQEQFEFRDMTTLVIDREQLVPVANLIRNTPELGYIFLVELTAVDHWPEEPRFAVNYIPYAFRYNTRFILKVRVPGDDPLLPTMVGVWPNANWYERELWDMFGIKSTDHPDLRRILMPEDWEGHPLRKDYPLGYEEVRFSFNWREIDEKKPYAKE